MSRVERTFVMLKPDAVERGFMGIVIKRFERKGLKLIAMKFNQASEELVKKHYIDMRNETFFNELVSFMTSGPVVPMVWEGLNAVKCVRGLVGNKSTVSSPPGTIRGDLCAMALRDAHGCVVHASDSTEAAQREIDLWFSIDELVEWSTLSEKRP